MDTGIILLIFTAAAVYSIVHVYRSLSGGEPRDACTRCPAMDLKPDPGKKVSPKSREKRA